MSTYDLNEYKRAKIMVEQLEKAMKIVDVCESSLIPYFKFRPVKHILTTIKEEKFFLGLALDQYRIILETKGENP